VGGEVFEIRASWHDILNALIEEWPRAFQSIITNQIFILYVKKNQLDEMLEECSPGSDHSADALAFEADELTWFCISKSGSVGASLLLSEENDQYGMPLFERIRWHAASHIFYKCETIGKYAIHASAAGRNGEAGLLFGNPGSGKSTLLAKLLSKGWDFISDDRVLLSSEDGIPVVEPFWHSIKLRDDVKHLPDVAHWFEKGKVIEESRYIDSKLGNCQRMIIADQKEGVCNIQKWKVGYCAYLNGTNNYPKIINSKTVYQQIIESMLLYSTMWSEIAYQVRKELLYTINDLATAVPHVQINGRTNSSVNGILQGWGIL